MKKGFYYLYILFIPIAGITQQADITAIYLQIDSLLLVAEDYQSKDNFQEMHDIAESAADIALKALGATDNKYANSLHLQAAALHALKQDKEAKDIVEKGLNIYELNVRIDSADYAASLSLKGLIYQKMTNYDQAEPLLLKAMSILGKVLGKEHPEYAESLGNMGELYYYMGQYEKAGQFFLASKSIRERVLGKDHPSYASSVNNLAVVYMKMGDYEESELFYKEAIFISGKIKDKVYANRLSNLAILLKKMGQYEKAESLYLEAISINEEMLGKADPQYALSLSNLAALYNRMGHYNKAEPLIIESKSIQEKVLGKEHRYYATSLQLLAELNQKTGNYDQAEPLLIETKSILGKVVGKDHPRYANSLKNLAALFTDMGYYDKAEPLYREAISILEKTLGKEHPDYAESLNGLALFYYAKKDYGKAGLFFRSANDISKTLLERAANHLSSIELQKYLLEFENDAAQFTSFIHQSESATLSGEWYNNNLFYKGFLLGNAMRIEQTAINAPDSIRELYYQWKVYQRRLSVQYSKPIVKRKMVLEIEEKANALEKELLRSLPALKDARRQVTWEEVRDQLKEGEAAIEFSHFQYYAPKATDSIFYMALVLLPGDSAPQPIFLFEEKELNKLLETKGARRADYANALYGLSDRGAVVLENKDKKTLYDLIWQPLKAALTDVKTIYYAPSGLLHRINLSAIPIDDEENLASQHELVRINSTRSLVFPSSLSTENNGVVLYGGLQYDNTQDVAVQTETRGGFWHFLKGTEREVHKLEGIMKSNGLEPTLFIGTHGTEESFKKYGLSTQASPRILHIATHGYFYPDPKITKAGEKDGQEPIFKISEQPMLRSGLILAGGNQYWENEKQKLEQEDGVLTALEISQMDLRQTELVVLSACETGLGDIQGNEGVYGLQRAFKIAGAKYIIMSLWQVPDKQTSSLMQHFYANWLEEKMPIREAFASAQRDLSEMGDPFHWAGFVLVE